MYLFRYTYEMSLALSLSMYVYLHTFIYTNNSCTTKSRLLFEQPSHLVLLDAGKALQIMLMGSTYFGEEARCRKQSPAAFCVALGLPSSLLCSHALNLSILLQRGSKPCW